MTADTSPTANAVSARFDSRPTLASVAQRLLHDAMMQTWPALIIDLDRTQLAIPSAGGGWTLHPLMPRVLAFLAEGTAPGLQDQHDRSCFLTDQPPTALKLPDGRPLDMTVVEGLITTLHWALPTALQNALADYWERAPQDDISQWRWLSDVLRDSLSLCVAHQPDLTAHERDMLDQIVRYPERDQRQARFDAGTVHAYFPHAQLKDGDQTQSLLSPELMLLSSTNGRPRALLCQPAGACERYASIDAALQAWATRTAQAFHVQQITLQSIDPESNLFDTQAAIILDRQLQQLEALKLPSHQGLPGLQAVYRHITDPAHAFVGTPIASPKVQATLRSQLPTWLQQASSADQARYRHYSLALASAKKRSEGRTFLSDIPDIRAFTHAALRKHLPLDPDDLQLTFSVAAGYPGGAGFVEKVHMSLTDLAIRNLQGRPRGQLSLAHRRNLPLPAEVTADAILGSEGLIQQVNIGQAYPELLKTQLLGDGPAVRDRERHFAEHTVAQLPLQALELSLRQQQGFNAQGAAYVAALMGNDPSLRQVEGDNIVIRHLTLVRKPQAAPDIVANMYIIETQSAQNGPHILYRPLYADALRQFASRQQLLDAIATPGDLQTSVLTWLSDGARPIYDNGGFAQPHYLRFGIGDEFELPQVPQPAALGMDGASDELLQFLANGQLMQYLYGANARALVDQADRESVSNHESRWAVFFEGAGLLFNTLLLPLARGPLMLTGWLLALMSSASRDIPGLNSDNPVTRELALVDLLLNVGMLMFQLAPATAPAPLPVETRWQALRSPLKRRTAEQWPQPPAPNLHQGEVLLDGASGLDTVFDFSYASARNRLTPSQQERLWRLQAPKPETLPTTVLNGPRRGLYRHLRDWYALIDNRWYELRLQNDGSVLIVNPFDSRQQGPYLQSDGHGNWSPDLRLRLRGGMPPKRIAAERERKAQRKQALVDEQARFLESPQGAQPGRPLKSLQQALQEKVDTAQQLMTRAGSDPKYSDAARANSRRNFDKALHEQMTAYRSLLDSRQERIELGIPMPIDVAAIFMENTVNNARKSVVIADMDRQALYAEHPDLSSRYDQALPAIIANPARYAQFLKAMSLINERQIQALELKDSYLLELYNLGQPGLDAFTRLTRDRPDELTALALKYLQLQNFKYLSKKTWQRSLASDALDLSMDPLGTHLRTHSELNKLNLPATDRLAVLDSLFEHYGQALDALEGMALVHAEGLDLTYFASLKALVESLYQDVVQQLAVEVKPQAEPLKRPPKRALAASGKPQKKVIKTRKQGILIGDVKPAGTTLPIESVQVRSEQAGQVLATYTLHEYGWDEVREQRRPSAPELPPGTRALNVVKGEARKQVKQLPQIIQRQERYAQVSRFPIEIQESLEAESRRFDERASELERAVSAQPDDQQTAADRDLINELQQAAQTLIAKSHELRTQRTLALAPTDSHVAYLLEQDKIQLARLGPRVALRGERRDFIQEYAINDKRGFPLWYAHFHYPAADTPKAQYSVAHMKTRAQRTESYYSLLAKAQNPQSVVEVHRGAISRELAERWFLPLAN